MPLETATFIPDLNPSNPAHTDGLGQADSHIRLLKSVIKNTFPNFTDVALASTQAELDAAVAAVTGTGPILFAGTDLLPGITPIGDPDTGFFPAAPNQIGVSLGGTQVMLLAGGALVTTLGIGAPAVASSGAYSGGTGQLVPIGSTLLWWEDALPPDGGYCWANGQVIASANTVAPVLLARWGSRFGGNGVTTMGVPDMRETVPVGKSTMGGAATRGPLSNFTTTVTNALIGLQNLTIQRSDLPNFQPAFAGIAGTVNVTSAGDVVQGSNMVGGIAGTSGNAEAPQNGFVGSVTSTGTFTPAGTIASINGNVTQTTPSVVQPSTVCNYIIRVG